MDDVAEAQALFDDLLALLDAGLVAAVEDGGTIRYAATAGAAPDADRPVDVAQST